MTIDVDFDIVWLKQLLSGLSIAVIFYSLYGTVLFRKKSLCIILKEKEVMLHLFEGRASI